MIAIIQLERNIAGARVFGLIISKLSYWWKPGPIILLEIDKSSNVCFPGTVLLFGLAVSLRMEGGKKLTLDIKKVAEQWPEFQDE